MSASQSAPPPTSDTVGDTVVDDALADDAATDESTTDADARRSARSRVNDLQDRARTVARNVEAARSDTPLIDTAYECWERDSSIAGSMLSGAIAFRLFLITVPLALVMYALLGFAAHGDSGAAKEIGDAIGLNGAVLSTMNNIGNDASRGRWITLGIGLYALVLALRTTVKAIRITFRLAWQLPTLPKVSAVRSIAAGVGLLAAAVGVAVVAAWLRMVVPGLGLVALALSGAMWAGLWMVVSKLLPHDDGASWSAFVPGAILFGAAMQGLHLFTVLYLTQRVTRMAETYGPLGVAVVMMLWLFLVARLISASAVLDAVLWDRRRRGVRSLSPVDPALFGISRTRKPK